MMNIFLILMCCSGKPLVIIFAACFYFYSYLNAELLLTFMINSTGVSRKADDAYPPVHYYPRVGVANLLFFYTYCFVIWCSLLRVSVFPVWSLSLNCIRLISARIVVDMHTLSICFLSLLLLLFYYLVSPCFYFFIFWYWITLLGFAGVTFASFLQPGKWIDNLKKKLKKH